MSDFSELADFIGPEAEHKVRKVWGGYRLYIPRRMIDEHPLADVLGRDLADRVVEVYAGSWIDYVPMPTREARDTAIREGFRKGNTIIDLIADFELSRRKIQNILFGESEE